jgi:hypothetical protein
MPGMFTSLTTRLNASASTASNASSALPDGLVVVPPISACQPAPRAGAVILDQQHLDCHYTPLPLPVDQRQLTRTQYHAHLRAQLQLP